MERILKRSKNWVVTRGFFDDSPEVILWDRSTGRRIARLEAQSFPFISPDGKTLVTFHHDARPDGSGPVLWDLPAPDGNRP
jgi:hypothetical protein